MSDRFSKSTEVEKVPGTFTIGHSESYQHKIYFFAGVAGVVEVGVPEKVRAGL